LVPEANKEHASDNRLFNPAKYAEEHGAKVIKTKKWTDWELAILEECPFNHDHSPGKARIGVKSNGARHFACFHNSCNDKNWKALKDLWGEPQKENVHKFTEEEFDAIHIQENPRFKTNLEPTNFLHEFLDYGKRTSDAYPDYWFAGGLFCLSVIIDKKMRIRLVQGIIYTNVYLNLLGLSTYARKSTAIDGAERHINGTDYEIERNVPEEFSPEAFIEHMDSYNHCNWIRDES
jgi:hypothetical protein